MTIIANIVERFAMQLEEPAPGHDEWFLDWVLRSPKNAGHHLTAGWLTLNDLKAVYRGDEIQTCNEWFGGMGAQALMAERLFNLRCHWVGEFSMDAVEHLERTLATRSPRTNIVEVFHRDAYAFSSSPESSFDLQILDFGDLTAWKTRDGEKHRQLLDRVFETQPKAVVLTDIACRYLHLHRERYESLLGPGSCASYETYLMALCARLKELYGYNLHSGHWDRWSAVMSFVPEDVGDFWKLVPTPAEPVGLELL